MFSRRCLLGIGWSAGYVFAAKDEIWNSKPAAEWSDAEVQKVLTRSPWVKEVSVSMSGGRMGSPGGMGGGRGGRGGGGGMGGMGGGGGMEGGMGGGGGGMGGMGGGGGMGGMGGGGMEGGGPSAPQFKAIVRWESARPIRDALKKPLPEALAGMYVFTVSGLPMMGGGGRPPGGGAVRQFQEGQQQPDQRRRDMGARIKDASKLTVKGKDPATPSFSQIVGAEDGGRGLVVVGFARDSLAITIEDKEAQFETQIGPFQVKTKFALKNMLYQGKLEL